MARRVPTDLAMAGKIKGMHDMGMSNKKISRTTDCPTSTVGDIIAGRHNWSNLVSDPEFAKYRKEQKRAMQVSSIELAKKALAQTEAGLTKSSAAQAAVIYAIMRDKERLDAGEPTEIRETVLRADIERLDELADKLSRSLKAERDAKEPIDVTPKAQVVDTEVVQAD